MLLNIYLPGSTIVAKIDGSFDQLVEKVGNNIFKIIDNTQARGEIEGVKFTITDSMIHNPGYTVDYRVGKIKASRFIPYSRGVIDFIKDCELVKSKYDELLAYPILDELSIVYLVLEGQKIGARYSKPGIKPLTFSKPPTIAQLKGFIRRMEKC